MMPICRAPPTRSVGAFRSASSARTPPFTKRQRRVFLIAATAGFFDQYDRALLTLALKQIQKGLQITEAALGNLLTLIRLGYIGSLFVTPLADVFGRRRLLLYTVVAYTIFTGLAAISPTAHFFVACEMLARVFAGAEGTIALVILSEEVDAGVRGWAIGLLSALASVGFGIAALAFAGIRVMPYGWRGLYALALIPLILIIPLRQALPESARFEREQLEGIGPRNVLAPVKALFSAYPGRLHHADDVRISRQPGRQSAGLLLFQIFAGSAWMVARQRFQPVLHGWSAGHHGKHNCRAAQRSLRAPANGRDLLCVRGRVRVLVVLVI